MGYAVGGVMGIGTEFRRRDRRLLSWAFGFVALVGRHATRTRFNDTVDR